MRALEQLVHRHLLYMTPKGPKPEEIEANSTLFSETREGKIDWVANSACLNCLHTDWVLPPWPGFAAQKSFLKPQGRNKAAPGPESCAEVTCKSRFSSVIWHGMKGPLTHFLDGVKKCNLTRCIPRKKLGSKRKEKNTFWRVT